MFLEYDSALLVVRNVSWFLECTIACHDSD